MHECVRRWLEYLNCNFTNSTLASRIGMSVIAIIEMYVRTYVYIVPDNFMFNYFRSFYIHVNHSFNHSIDVY